jgi:hypothetical protein
MKLIETEKPINNIFALEIGFKYLHYVIRDDRTLVPKCLGGSVLMIGIIKAIHVVGKRSGVS